VHYKNLKDMIAVERPALMKGPVAVVMVEDEVEMDTSLRHHQMMGFASVIALMPASFALPGDLRETVIRVDYDLYYEGAMERAINTLMDPLAGQWLYYCYNAEYLFFPFCETRSIGEMLAFHTEERRDAMLAYVVDLYADDLTEHPNAVSLDFAHLDRSGYYAAARKGPADAPKERQLDFFGGLRWRFEEHVPVERRKIDRIPLFRAKAGLRLRWDHTFSDEEYNTYACPWHNNLTASICSFRTAKALRSNPPFEWHSRQLLDLGLMEPGQWF